MIGFPLSLPQASDTARRVDVAFFSVLGISGAILLLLLVLTIVFSVRYHRGSRARRGPLPKLLRREIEIGWTATTVFLAVFIFWWFVGGMYFPRRALPHQLEIHIVAKQWMWKAQHPDGAREINALHLPVGTPVRLVMTSQDVIHSFYIPAFRLKQDVLPVISTELEFTPIQTGSFHLFCAEYCGAQHSRMTGEIVILTEPQYEAWLRRQPHEDSPAREGETLYATFGCGACHSPESRVAAPKLGGIAGHDVRLQSGTTIKADDEYLKRSILRPQADIVAGYAPIMPSYASIADSAQADALVAYIKSLPKEDAP